MAIALVCRQADGIICWQVGRQEGRQSDNQAHGQGGGQRGESLPKTVYEEGLGARITTTSLLKETAHITTRYGTP